jgi:hypothetical protein
MRVQEGTLLIRNPNEPVDGNPKAGALYVLTEAGSNTQPTRIVSTNPRKNGRFGHRHDQVVIADGTIVVKDWDETVGSQPKAGALYVLSQGAGSTPVRLVSQTPRKNGRFGHGASKIYFQDGAVVVTDPHETVDGKSRAGAVYVLTQAGTTVRHVAPTAQKNAQLGRPGTSAFWGNGELCLGNRLHSGVSKSVNVAAGAVSAFTLSDTPELVQQISLSEEQIMTAQRFGSAVVATTDTLWVGAPYYSHKIGPKAKAWHSSGAVFVFQRIQSGLVDADSVPTLVTAPKPAKMPDLGHPLL